VFHVEQRESSTFARSLTGGLILNVLVSRGTVVIAVEGMLTTRLFHVKQAFFVPG
jgi:hypothetical protein